MTSIREILKGIDPLERESLWTLQERNVVRQQVLSSASKSNLKQVRWSFRFPIAAVVIIAVLSVVIGLGIGPDIWSHFVTNVQAAVPFEMRLAEDSPASGLSPAIVVGTNRTIYLYPDALLTNSDIARATVVPGRDQGVFNVDVVFSSEGSAKMHRATAEHIGRPVALLVDGNVINAPTIRSAIDTSAIINGNFTEAEAGIMAAGIGKH